MRLTAPGAFGIITNSLFCSNATEQNAFSIASALSAAFQVFKMSWGLTTIP
jgi:hypothetical protein